MAEFLEEAEYDASMPIEVVMTWSGQYAVYDCYDTDRRGGLNA